MGELASQHADMQCEICAAQPTSIKTLTCPACARGALYPLRTRYVHVLLEKQKLARQVETIVKDSNKERQRKPSHNSRSLALEHARAQIEESRISIDLHTTRIEELRQDMERYKRDLSRRKATERQRQLDLDLAKNKAQKSQERALLTLKEDNSSAALRLEVIYHRIVTSRAYLCREAAGLANLQRNFDKSNEGSVDNLYTLGGVKVSNFQDLNTLTAQEISAFLTNVARLVSLTCRYLHIRLPAEIILPHANHPFPMIMSPSSSYLARETSHVPALLTRSSTANQRDSGEAQSRSSARPRPLFLDRPLPQLAREDPPGFSLFIEGITLLTWDVAWLCRMQGLPVAATDWQDFCAIGQNLWLLLAAPPTKPSRAILGTAKKTFEDFNTIEENPPRDKMRPLHAFGTFSHGSAYKFLRGSTVPQTLEIDMSIRNWHFSSPAKIRDNLKAALVADMSGLEWEMLDEKEFALMHAKHDSSLAVNTREDLGTDKAELTQIADESILNTGTVGIQTIAEDGKARGTSGWTKLKSRSEM